MALTHLCNSCVVAEELCVGVTERSYKTNSAKADRDCILVLSFGTVCRTWVIRTSVNQQHVVAPFQRYQHIGLACQHLAVCNRSCTCKKRSVLSMCGDATLRAVTPGSCRIILEALVAVPAEEAPAGPAGIHLASALAFQVSLARGAHQTLTRVLGQPWLAGSTIIARQQGGFEGTAWHAIVVHRVAPEADGIGASRADMHVTQDMHTLLLDIPVGVQRKVALWNGAGTPPSDCIRCNSGVEWSTGKVAQ